MINLLDNTPNQPFKFRIKNWVEINHDSHGTYNTNSQIEFKTSMLELSLCDYSDAYILVKELQELLEMQDHQQKEQGHTYKQQKKRLKNNRSNI